MRFTAIIRYPKVLPSHSPKAPFPRQGTDFNKLFVQPQKPRKAWEGQDKDAFFRDKYAHVHAKQLKRKKIEQQIKRDNLLKSKPLHGEKKPSPKITGQPDFYSKFMQKLIDHPEFEYIYGTNAVKAVLKQRKCTKLFTGASSRAGLDPDIWSLCMNCEIPVEFDVPMQHLQIMSSQGVHNKVVVETEKLKIPSVSSIQWLDGKFVVNGGKLNILSELHDGVEQSGKLEVSFPRVRRFPLGIFIDQVTDTHNMGALLRSALWFGVDFVAFSSRNSAPINPAVVKASSGASEFLRIWDILKPLSLFDSLRADGWSIVASAPDESQLKTHQIHLTSIKPENLKQLEAPTVLVVGNEGDGIRTSLLQRSTHSTTIKTCQNEIDSLNVSVATAIILSRFAE